ncbi:glycoside hydrolase family 45 protein [Calycina marina]|uniref:Cellulase n=1 Tax=Calycina marina TaxID=1763456 RepID=A0A9P7Z3P8_9HELO|nr:glycoside hydrolase family 45 protein [Calycina marina]
MLSTKALFALLPYLLHATAQVSGSGTTTRYWDCCKPSCGWPGKLTLASGATPVLSCDINDKSLEDMNAVSGCNGGGAYTCTDQSPWAVSETLSYGFAATTIAGGTEASWCCACYQLTFTSGAVAGKQLIVQATNTGGDLGSNQFDLAMPGGGFGIFDGCTTEFGTPSGGWGAQYGGISERSQCDSFPSALQAGCYWRFDWFENADNPAITFEQVTCPAALTAKSGCVRSGETPTGADTVATYSSGAVSSTSEVKVVEGTSTRSLSTSAPSSSTLVKSSSSTPIVKPSTSSTPTAVFSSSTSETSPGGSAGAPIGADLYGQCGGLGWSGPTSCIIGTCTVSNPYYSQCLM